MRTQNSCEQTARINPHLVYQQDRRRELSSDYYKQTRVNTCSFVQIDQGNPTAVPYYKTHKKFNIKDQYDTSLTWFNIIYKIQHLMHVGSKSKKLITYNPTALRSRLMVPELPLISHNSSKIDLQDGSFCKTKINFSTVANSTYGIFSQIGYAVNPGILSMKTKWHRRRTHA